MKKGMKKLSALVLAFVVSLTTLFSAAPITAQADETDSTKSYQWQEVSLSDVTSSDTIAITITASDGTTYAMNNATTGSDKKPVAVKGKIVDGVFTITDTNYSDSNLGLTITPVIHEETTDESGNSVAAYTSYVITNSEGKYLYANNSNASYIGGTKVEWVLDSESGYLKTTLSQTKDGTTTYTDRFLGVYTGASDWRTYTSISNNIKNESLKFFKLAEVDASEDTSTTTTQSCATVTASPSTENTLAAGDKVTLSCDTEGATIYYSTTSADTGYVAYSEPIALSETTTIYAYASKDGYADSAKAEFKYTVEPKAEDQTYYATELDTLAADETVMITYSSETTNTASDGTKTSTVSTYVMGETANGKALTATSVTKQASTDFIELTASSDFAYLTVIANEDGTYSFTNRDGQYLTCPATGSGLSFGTEKDENNNWKKDDYSNWTLIKKDDGLVIQNTKASYTKNNVAYNQAIEYYSKFTTYSYLDGTTDAAVYTMQFYSVPSNFLTYLDNLDATTETPSTDETEEEEETAAATLLTRSGLYEGDELVIYFENGTSDGLVLTSEASGSKLTGATAVPSEGKLNVPDTAAVLTVELTSDGYAMFKNSEGKYLTSGATGSSLTFTESATDYSVWELKSADDNNGFYIVNVNAKYGSSNQYIEYYKGFTTYSYKSSSDAVYVYNLYLVKAGTKTYLTDKNTTVTVAQWAGNANYEEAGIITEIPGDIYETNDLLDTDSIFTAVVSGKTTQAYTKATSTTTGSTSYYMGSTGVGSGTDDYMQFELSSAGIGNMDMSFRLRASNTAIGSLQLQYSVDGKSFENFTDGTYSYAYTAYDSDGSSSNVSKEGTITDGIAKTSYAPTYYINFDFTVPAGANNANKLYIRLVPVGTDGAKSGKTVATGGVLRIDSVVISGNPIVDDSVVGYVSADPESGAIALGTSINLTTSTEGATIYYSMNGGDYKAYDAENAPILETSPTTIRAYATKEGLTKSITTTYSYTQAQCSSIKATPNGGAVTKGSRVTLKCATEDSAIYYRLVSTTTDEDTNSDEDETEESETTDETEVATTAEESTGEWTLYESPIVLNDFPTVIEVKATKSGYLDSAVSTLKFTEKSSDKYNIYFGQIHAHTNYSDGAGSCEEAFAYATEVDNLDFLAVTDHSNSLDNASDSVITKNVDTAETDEWTMGHTLAEKYTTADDPTTEEDESFTCIYGYEMTWSNGLGHINTFNTEGFQSRTQTAYSTYSTALQNYYAALQTAPDSISQFNHPGTTFGDFSDFAYYTEDNDALITMIEVGNGEGTIGSSGYFPSYEYYTRALDKGWHVSPTNNQDNHKGKWGDANTARTVVLADTNDEDAIYDAMRNYRIYATEDNNLSIYYTLDNYVMGTILEQDAVGDTVNIKAEISDADASDSIGTVEVIVNGGLSIASKQISSNEETVEFEVPSSYSYYYLKITEADGDIAVTSPVWVGEVEACGINSTYTNTALAVQGESLDVNVDLYNNEKTELVIDDIEITITDAESNTSEVVTVTGEEAGIASVAANSTATYTYDYVYASAGKVTYNVTVHATLNGVAKTYTDKLSANYVVPEMVTNIIVDGTHYNDYVTGYYGGNLTSLVDIAADMSVKLTVESEEITADDLEDCSLLILSAPAKKTGTANAGDYTPSHYSDEFLKMVSEYVANGGSVIVCGLADYSDTTSGQTATEQNKLLAAIGSTIRMNSDEVYDEENNGGQAYRLYPTNFNTDSKYLDGVVEGQTYSQYSGCSVDVSNATENDTVYAAESLVMGFDTTYSIDCKDADGNSAGNTANDNKGNITFLAHQSTKAGGNIFVAGGVFMSDFEVDAEIDNNDSLPYANYNIICNIISEVEVELETSTIAEARAGETGDVFAVEGYVTSGTSNEYTTFFDTIYIQDETAGIDIFPYSTSGLEIGTKMRIVGFVSSYQGDKELKVISTEILDDDKVVLDPTVVSTADAMDYDKLGGSLLKTTGTVSKVEYASDGTTVSEFWINDGTGEAAIFIDGYIYSGTTGKNELADFVKVGAEVSAIGVLYMHPEGDSDESVPVFRVRDCDDIELITAGETVEDDSKDDNTGNTSDDNSGNSSSDSSSTGINYFAQYLKNLAAKAWQAYQAAKNAVVNTVKNVVSNIVGAITGNGNGNNNNDDATTEAVDETTQDEREDERDAEEEAIEEMAAAQDYDTVEDEETPLAAEPEVEDSTSQSFPVAPVAGGIVVVLLAAAFVTSKMGYWRIEDGKLFFGKKN